MGQDISHKLIIGNAVCSLSLDEDEDVTHWVESHGMVTTSPHYDSDEQMWDFGFEINPCKAEDMDTEWLAKLQHYAAEFTNITGLQATLMSVNDVT